MKFRLSFITLTLATLILSQIAKAISNAEALEQRQALLELYEATNGDLWSENYGWEEAYKGVKSNSEGKSSGSAEIHFCEWYGVICEGSNDIPADLEETLVEQEQQSRQRLLQNRGLSQHNYRLEDGSQGESRKNDSKGSNRVTNKIIGLSLSSNFLNGRIPDSLWTLPHLQYLELSFNPLLEVSFQRRQPTSEITISPLLILKMHQTATKDLTGIATLLSPTLSALHLSRNDFHAIIPKEIYELTSLVKMQFAHCAFQGTISSDIQNLSNLKFLNLFHNELQGNIPSEIATLTNLRRWSIGDNSMVGTIPDLGALTDLEEVFFNNNHFNGRIPDFKTQTELQRVYLNGNKFTGSIPETFLQSITSPTEDEDAETDGSVIVLNLADNFLTGKISNTSLGHLKDIQMEIRLQNNEFTSIDEDICYYSMWNNGDVAEYECDGILCPEHTYSAVGRKTDEHTCHSCKATAVTNVIGQTSCGEDDDRSILVSIYLNTNGENWLNNSGWLSNDNVCSWYGVSCVNEMDDQIDVNNPDRVREIDLSNNNLNGTIPDSIYALPYLHILTLSTNPNLILPFTTIGTSYTIRHIDISNTATNDYHGIDKASGQFSYLYADQTPIKGTLPEQLYYVKSLRTLSLTECGIIGQLSDEIDYISSLHSLYLYNNDIRGTIPDTIQYLPHLRVLSLAKNQLTGTIPSSLDKLPHLYALSLSDQVTKGGGLTGTLPSFETTSSLRSLLFNKNALTGEIPEDLFKNMYSDDIITLDLSYNQFSGVIPKTLGYFDSLNIYLESNRFEHIDSRLCEKDSWMNGLVGEYKCDAILCPGGTYTGRQKDDFSPCQKCASEVTTKQHKWLGQVACPGDDDEDILLLSQRDILQKLYDEANGRNWVNKNNWSTNEDICTWYGISCDDTMSVVTISLGANRLIGDIPKEIFRLPKLQKLSLYENNINFQFKGIEYAHHLESLSLDHTGLKSLEGVGQARSIIELNVQSNQLSGPIPNELYRLIGIKTITLSDNTLTGSIPSYFSKNLPSLTSFLASNNQLTGPVPDFSNLYELKYLDLSDNQLSGALPKSLVKNMQNSDEKVVIDLSSNRITGKVPGDYATLKHLTIRLEKNMITGIDINLCEVDSINNYDVQSFGCDAILCPMGTSNEVGRQTSMATPCIPCPKAKKYMGSTLCRDTSTSIAASLQRKSWFNSLMGACFVTLIFWTI